MTKEQGNMKQEAMERHDLAEQIREYSTDGRALNQRAVFVIPPERAPELYRKPEAGENVADVLAGVAESLRVEPAAGPARDDEQSTEHANAEHANVEHKEFDESFGASADLGGALIEQMVVARAMQKITVYAKPPADHPLEGVQPIPHDRDRHAESVLGIVARQVGVSVPDNAELDRRADEFLRTLSFAGLSTVGATRKEELS